MRLRGSACRIGPAAPSSPPWPEAEAALSVDRLATEQARDGLVGR